MKLIDCYNCGNIVRTCKTRITCNICGEAMVDTSIVKAYDFSCGVTCFDIDPNPNGGKLYKVNTRCCDEFKKMVEDKVKLDE